MLRGISVIFAFGLLFGCGDDVVPPDTSLPDAGTDTSLADSSITIAAPEIPWLAEGAPPVAPPVLTPCPAGWREVVDEDVTTCHPYPVGGPGDCPAGEAHFVGEPSCRAIGSACPAGDYAASLPSDGPVLYVRAGAPAGGTGSMASPYASLSAVRWTGLSPGTIVAIAKGTYPGVIGVRTSVRIIGACAGETILVGQAGAAQAVVTVAGATADVLVRDVTISEPPQLGAQIAGGTLTLDGVRIDGTLVLGVLVAGATSALVAEDVVIENTRPQSPADPFGRGINVELGGSLDGTRMIFSGNTDTGVFGSGAGVSITLADSVVRDTLPDIRDGTDGLGISVADGTRLELSRVLVSGNRAVGVSSRDPGTAVVLSDVVVEDTSSETVGGEGGDGLSVLDGATLEATRTLISRSHNAGGTFGYAGVDVTLTDVVVRDTEPREGDDEVGIGIAILADTTVTATRLLVSSSYAGGVVHQGATGNVVLTDVTVRDTRPQRSDGYTGTGLSSHGGGRVTATRLLVAGSHGSGIFVTGGDLTLEDAAVIDTAPNDGRDFSAGIEVAATRFDATRLYVASVAGIGIQIAEEATAVLADVAVRDTTNETSIFTGGRGINVQQGSELDAMRVEIANTGDQGITSISAATVRASDVRIPGGVDMGASGASGMLSLERFEIRGADTCGIFVAKIPWEEQQPGVDLRTGVVAESAIGACVQANDYEVSRLQSDVIYLGNGTNLDVTMLPVPEIFGLEEM